MLYAFADEYGLLAKAYQRQGVQAILINPAAEALLLLRDNNPSTVYPGMWSPPGGGIETGETREAALKREVREETGWPLQDFSLFTRSFNPVRRALNHVFAAAVEGPEDLFTLGEGQAKRFFPFREMAQLDMPPFVRDFMRSFYRSSLPDLVLQQNAQHEAGMVLRV